MMKQAFVWIERNWISLLVGACTLAVFAVFAPQVLLIITGVGVLAWASYTPPTPPPVDDGYPQCLNMLYRILAEEADDLGVLCPKSPELFIASRSTFGNVKAITVQIERKISGTACTPKQFRNRLQQRIYTALMAGEVPNVYPLAVDQMTPIYYILDVDAASSALTYTIQIVCLNSWEQYNGAREIYERRKRLEQQRLNQPHRQDLIDDL